ncbi:MAG: beta-glucosidase [Bacteroidetes bacterium]|nr:beta-glucosidase [Bacteroidota bacterium]
MMGTRTRILSLILGLLFVGCMDDANKTPNPEKAAEEAINKQVAEIMSGLTLDDKVGEMTQFAIDMLSVGEPYDLEKPHQLDPEKLQKVLVDLKVGSILNVGGYAYTREHWHEIMTTIKEYTDKKESKIPVLYGIDAIHGTNYTIGATLYPQQAGLAATWNPQLVEELGKITAYETRASYIPWTFSPVCDLGRDARWPRLWEGFGEDPLLASDMAVALVNGFQGEDPSDKYQVAACLKHYLGYSRPLTGMDRTQAWIPERQLREYFLPSFKAAVDAGALTIMINSGDMNGIPTHIDKYVLTDILRGELGFKGLAVTDWEDIKYLFTRHRVAKDHKEAIAMAINAGVDMSMVPNDIEFPTLLKECVEEGLVPMSRINESVERILRVKVQLGLFEEMFHDPADYPDFNSEEFENLAYLGAVESLVLAKNEDNALPLSRESNILVTGPTANSMIPLNGGWTFTWQGNEEQYFAEDDMTILEALQEKLGDKRVRYVEGTTYDEAVNIQAATTAARSADAVVVCIGEFSYTEYVGNLNDLNLPQAQQELVKAVAAAGKPVILVVTEGRPRIIRDIEGLADGVLLSLYPGNQGGKAIASVLFGDENPSGKLPYTYPQAANALIPYDYRGTDKYSIDIEEQGLAPQYPFGHGLSYTSFEYGDISLSADSLSANGEITVSIDVTNTGSRGGKEVVQLYTADLVASIAPSVRRLRGFEKVQLKPGESKTVSFSLTPRDLAFVGRQNKWQTEPGQFEVYIADKSATFDFKSENLIFFK